MKKIMVIINPTSGGEKALDYKVKLENKARDYFEHVQIKITRRRKTPQTLQKKLLVSNMMLFLYLVVMVAITLRRLKDVSRNISRKSMDMTFLKRQMKFVLRTVSMKRFRIPFLKLSLPFWRVQILKMRFEMRFLLVETVILLLQSQEISPRQLMEFLSGLRIRP